MNGPWKWSESGLQLLDNTGRAVLTIRPSDATEQEFSAIETAPELLESLKRLESRIVWRDDLHRWAIDDGSSRDFLTVDALRVARLAIAKAEAR